MNPRFFWISFALGLAAIVWVGAGFATGHPLALAMTLAIAGAYLLGAHELRQFRADSIALANALPAQSDGAPPDATAQGAQQGPALLGDWLQQVPAALRTVVQQRITQGRGALPGPALTPYLVGLLVMLGMLGTFLGMVVTFRGAVFALEGSTDLQAIRAALAEPIRGLGLSFGTSVAGVAASAMLGLMSAMARRERLGVARLLDQHIATTLRRFTPAHQRDEALRAAQAQAGLLPAVVDRLDAMMSRIEQRSQQLDAQLLAAHTRMQQETTAACTTLARDLGQALQANLSAGAQAAGEAIRPVMASAMERIAQDQSERMGQLAALWDTQLATLRTEEQRRGEAAVARLGELQAALAQHLAKLGTALEAPLARLLATASEVPQAAAGVLAQLRQEMAQLSQQENAALAERAVLVERLGTLMQTVQQAAQQATQMAQHANASAVEMAAWGDAFGQAVEQFHAGQQKLVGTLAQVEAAITRSTERSDEQLAYYVTQAREVIDLSITAQHGVLERLRTLGLQPVPAAASAQPAQPAQPALAGAEA